MILLKEVRYAPRIIKNPRNNSRYKRLAYLPYNILNTSKIFKFKHKKWVALQSQKTNYQSRICINNFKRINTLINNTKKETRLIKKETRFFLNQIRIYRIFKFWYNIKKRKQIKNYYKKNSSIVIQKNNKLKYTNCTKILNLINQFEYRLDIILFRSFFLPSIYYSQKLILQKAIFLNKNIITYSNFLTKSSDLIEINPKFHFLLLTNIKKQLKKNYKQKFLSLLNYKHLEINYNILTIYIIKQLTLLKNYNTFYPFNFNIFSFKQYLVKKF